MAGKLLHDLGVHALLGEQGEVGVSELVEREVVGAVVSRSSGHQRDNELGLMRSKYSAWRAPWP